MVRWLVVLLAALCCPALCCAAVGCSSSGPRGSYGQPCDDESQCGTDAPRCVGFAAPDYAPGICARDCPASGSCEPGSECRDGACIRCVASIAGSLVAGAACGCDADCAEGTCVAGTCAVDCRHSPCPSGSSCDGAPPTCRECMGGTPSSENGPCSCDLDCGAGLQCIGDLCLRPCTIDEMCGADECRHELLVAPPACAVPDSACTGAGTTGPGQECACNADCGPLSPLCVGAFLAGNPTGRCGQPCGPEMLCPSGTMCCSVIVGRAYCIPPEYVQAFGASCL